MAVVDDSGRLQGQLLIGGTGSDGIRGIIATNKGLIIAGNTFRGGASGNAIQNNLPLPDGSVVVTGYTNSFSAAGANNNIFLARLQTEHFAAMELLLYFLPQI